MIPIIHETTDCVCFSFERTDCVCFSFERTDCVCFSFERTDCVYFSFERIDCVCFSFERTDCVCFSFERTDCVCFSFERTDCVYFSFERTDCVCFSFERTDCVCFSFERTDCVCFSFARTDCVCFSFTRTDSVCRSSALHGLTVSISVCTNWFCLLQLCTDCFGQRTACRTTPSFTCAQGTTRPCSGCWELATPMTKLWTSSGSTRDSLTRWWPCWPTVSLSSCPPSRGASGSWLMRVLCWVTWLCPTAGITALRLSAVTWTLRKYPDFTGLSFLKYQVRRFIHRNNSFFSSLFSFFVFVISFFVMIFIISLSSFIRNHILCQANLASEK